ncbi:MAG: dihydrofolate reductase family protein [bacterium]|nr:dihydrofolate reductase family protein [bacterium]
MRNVVVTEFISLDGVIENPGWTFPYWNDEIAAFKAEETNAADALLLGRVTYEGFAAAWPQSSDEGAPYMNSVAKYVATRTLTNLEWNNSHVLEGDVVEAVKRLKQQDGRDILVYGSMTLSQTLMQHDLVDVYRFLVYPVVLGTGMRFFQDGNNLKLNLVSSQQFSSGVVGLIYHPART